MTKKRKRPKKSRSILLAAADEFEKSLGDGVNEEVALIEVSEPSKAVEQFHSKRPALVLCDLDNDGSRFNPLFLAAARCSVPVIAVASTKELTKGIQSVAHFLDRRAVRSVVSLADKLLENPSFMPNNLNSYPPPPKAANLDKQGAMGVTVTTAQVLTSDSRQHPPDQGAAKDGEEYHTSGKVVDHGRTIEHLVENIEHLSQDEVLAQLSKHAEAVNALSQRVLSLEESNRVERKDSGEFISAVAAEGAAFYNELKDSIATLSSRTSTVNANLAKMIDDVSDESKRSIEALRESLSDVVSKLQLGGFSGDAPAFDEHIERLSMSMVERQTQIDSLQNAIAAVDAKGSERETNFQERIDALVNQITKLESDPPIPAYSDTTEGVSGNLVAEFENRFTDIEIAIARLEKAVREGGGGGGDFTSDFEELWDTQLTIENLKNRLDTLESVAPPYATESVATASSEGIPISGPSREAVDELKRIQLSLKKRLSGMDQRFSAFEATLTELERRFDVIAKVPQTQFATLEQRLRGLETKLGQGAEAGSIKNEGSGTWELDPRLSAAFRRQEGFENRLEQLEKMIQRTERSTDETVLQDELDLPRHSRPTLKGTIRSWTAENSENRVVQRSIIKTSSVPPSARNTESPRFSERATLLGVDRPMAKGPGPGDEKK